MSLKSKLTALISLLVLVVVFTTSTLYLSSLTRQALAEVRRKGQYVAYEVYNEARTPWRKAACRRARVLRTRRRSADYVRDTLAADQGLATLMDSAVGYSPSSITSPSRTPSRNALVHTEPG